MKNSQLISVCIRSQFDPRKQSNVKYYNKGRFRLLKKSRCSWMLRICKILFHLPLVHLHRLIRRTAGCWMEVSWVIQRWLLTRTETQHSSSIKGACCLGFYRKDRVIWAIISRSRASLLNSDIVSLRILIKKGLDHLGGNRFWLGWIIRIRVTSSSKDLSGMVCCNSKGWPKGITISTKITRWCPWRFSSQLSQTDIRISYLRNSSLYREGD